MATEWALEKAAQVWTADKVVDHKLIVAFADVIDAALDEYQAFISSGVQACLDDTRSLAESLRFMSAPWHRPSPVKRPKKKPTKS